MRILHVITGLGRGGAPTMLYRLVKALPEDAGYQHEIVSLLEKERFDHDFGRLGVQLHSLNIRHRIPSLRALLRLRCIVKQVQPDVIQGWMYHANIAATLGAARRAPVVWGVHHSLHTREKLLTQAIIRLGPKFARGAARIVFCSETSAHQHQEIGYPADRSVFIPNGVDTEVFRPLDDMAWARRATLKLPQAAVLVGNAARYHPMKNHVGLVRAFAILSRRFPEARLVMAGRDVTRSNRELVTDIRARSLGGRVFLLGERSDMPQLLPAVDVYVSASRGEAFPVVLCEAMACGVPCVTTAVGDCAAIVGDVGRVTPVGDDGALAAAIGELLMLSPERRRDLGMQARQRVNERYSLRRVAKEYATLYKSVFSEFRAAGSIE